MRTLSTALIAGFLSTIGASPSFAIFIEDLGTVSVPGTRTFGNADTINGTFNNDFQFTIDVPAPSGATDVIEVELLPTFEIDQFTVSLFRADTSSVPPVSTGAALTSTSSILLDFPGDPNREVHAAFLALPALAAGSYIINVTGTATGELGGSYAGNLAIAPLPGAILLFGSALVGLAAVRRYRQNATEA